MEKESFSMNNSLAAKGAAILMMLWHHCFSSVALHEKYAVNFWPLSQSQVVHIQSFCKLCVSLFAFISGYGLYLSYRKHQREGNHPTGWILEKAVKTLSGYWFVLILAWIICAFLDGRPYRVYGFETSPFLGIWNMFVEFLGLTNLTRGSALNSHWWYMSAAVVFIVLLPLIYAGFEKLGCLCVIGAVFVLPRILDEYPGGTHWLSFLPVFCFGMVFARYDLFGAWKRFWGRWKGKLTVGVPKFAVMLMLLGLACKLYYYLPTKTWWDIKWNVFPLFLILILYDYVFTFRALNNVLIILGKHATNIFLIHNFIKGAYGQMFIYGMERNFILIVLLLLSCSLVCSVITELLKKAVRYEEGINKLLRAVGKVKIKSDVP